MVIVVGDEVLGGEVADANGPLCLRVLAEEGTRALGLRVVPDDLGPLTAAVRDARGETGLVLVTGGIGPTHDDCTRPAVAAALERPLAVHPEAAERVRSMSGPSPTAEEMAMAELPVGSALLTAPGLLAFGFEVDGVLVFPGPPSFLARILEAHRSRLAGRPWTRREVSTRLREGEIAAPFAGLAARMPHVRWGSYPRILGAGWGLTLVLRAPDEAAAREAEAALRRLLADHGDPGPP
jgi:molybdenum cofactor synthesis domain-containing protein